MDRWHLLIGLGNPGMGYAMTRHNLGFCVVDALAAQYQIAWHREKRVHGVLGEGYIQGQRVFLLKPETYMNSSGESVRACLDWFRLQRSAMCVVCDDIYLTFGQMRLRAMGGDGGHNGLKSLSTHLGSTGYARLRMGIGEPKGLEENAQTLALSDHVLMPFTREEQQELPAFVDRAVEILACFVTKGIEAAQRCPQQRRGEEDGEKTDRTSL